MQLPALRWERSMSNAELKKHSTGMGKEGNAIVRKEIARRARKRKKHESTTSK